MTESVRGQSTDVSLLAFYGIDHSESNVGQFLELAVTWLRSLGCKPDKLSLDGPKYSGKLGTFSRALAKTNRFGFKEVTGLEVYSILPDANLWWNDYLVAARYEGVKAGTHVSFSVRQSIARLGDPAIGRMATDVVALLKPAYGFGRTMSADDGPGLYVFGINMGAPGHVPSGREYEEELRVCRWGDTAMGRGVYRKGIIRDVYPQNYLTEVHLKRPVNDASLEEWIRQDATRGTLAPLAGDMVLWSIEEPYVETVKAALRPTEVVFDWTRYIGPKAKTVD